MFRLRNCLTVFLVGFLINCSNALELDYTSIRAQAGVETNVGDTASTKYFKDRFTNREDMKSLFLKDDAKEFQKKLIQAVNNLGFELSKNDLTTSQGDITTSMKEFKAVVAVLKRDKKSDVLNNLRFIVFCQFIATLRPIKNEKWQDAINLHLSQTMQDYVTAMLREEKNENIKLFSKVLLVHEYSSFARFLLAQEFNHKMAPLYHAFILLMKHSVDHQKNKFPAVLMRAYNEIRQTVNALDLITSYAVLNKANIKSDSPKLQYNPKYKFYEELIKENRSPNAVLSYHTTFVQEMNIYLQTAVTHNKIESHDEDDRIFYALVFCGLQELANHEKKAELLEKTNVNLAIFELVGKKDNFVKLLCDELKTLYATSKAIHVGLSQQISQLNQFIDNKINGYDECYLKLLYPAYINDTQGNYLEEIYNKTALISENIFKPNGLEQYKQALQIFRNMGTDFILEARMDLYYAYYRFIGDKKVFDENLSELMKIDQLHAATFRSDPFYLKRFERMPQILSKLLKKTIDNYKSIFHVVKNESKETRFKQRLVLKSALCWLNEAYGVDFVAFYKSKIQKTRFSKLASKSAEVGCQQILSILKFFFALAVHDGEEMANDHLLIYEYTYLMENLPIEVIKSYIESKDEEFQFMHKKIDEKSPANNPTIYLSQLYVAGHIKMFQTLNPKEKFPIKIPDFFVENLVHFIAKLNSKLTDVLFKRLVHSMLSITYKKFHNELMDSAHEHMKDFVDSSLDWIVNGFFKNSMNSKKAEVPMALLHSILDLKTAFCDDTKLIEKTLTLELLSRLDQVTYGCRFEYAKQFNDEIKELHEELIEEHDLY